MTAESNRAIEELIFIINSYCESRNIPYVIVGGIAVLFWGRTRTTHDVDVIIDHENLDLVDFTNYLKEHGVHCSIDDLRSAFNSKQHSNSNFYRDTTFRLDIKGVYSLSEKDSLNNRVSQPWKETIIYIDDIHSLIINKLIFGSQQDHEDALAVLIRNVDKINLHNLHEMAKKYNIEDDLSELLEKADLENNGTY